MKFCLNFPGSCLNFLLNFCFRDKLYNEGFPFASAVRAESLESLVINKGSWNPTSGRNLNQMKYQLRDYLDVLLRLCLGSGFQKHKLKNTHPCFKLVHEVCWAGSHRPGKNIWVILFWFTPVLRVKVKWKLPCLPFFFFFLTDRWVEKYFQNFQKSTFRKLHGKLNSGTWDSDDQTSCYINGYWLLNAF